MQLIGIFFIDILTLLHKIMAKCQISCGDIEMAKRRLGQARIILKLGNIFLYQTLPQSNRKQIKLA